MDRNYLKNTAVYILTSIVSLLIIYYIARAAAGSFTNEVETTLAEIATERETSEFEAYILRSESVIFAGSSGGISYMYDDGERVGTGCTLADIYGEGDGGEARSRVIELEKKINILENSNIAENLTISDTTALDSQLAKLFNSLRYGAETGDLNYAVRKRDEFLTLLNKRQVITRTVTSFDDRIQQLENEKLLAATRVENIAETVKAEKAGYFYSELDGYERTFSASKAATLTLGEFERMKSSAPEDFVTGGADGYGIGKMVTSFTWYIVCETTQESLKDFRHGSSYTVVFPYSGDAEIKMTLSRIVAEPNNNRLLMIFSTGTIPENFNFLRRQTVEVVKASFTGYRVPISAVRINDGRQGVYTLDGNMVYFREIVPLTEAGGYFIVEKRDPQGDPNYAYKLNLFDQIITKGKNLYEGKIID